MSAICACGCGLELPTDKQGRSTTYRKGHHFRKQGPRFTIEDCGYSTPCMIWNGQLNKDGYAIGWHEGRTRQMHIVYYRRAHPEHLPGYPLDHLCRQRPCVNDKHMEPVTNAENVRRGLSAKLSAQAVLEIKSRPFDRGADLAREYRVSPQTICDIRKGRKWADIDPRGHRMYQGRARR